MELPQNHVQWHALVLAMFEHLDSALRVLVN